MQKLCAEAGTLLIWVTHDLTVVAGLADKLAVMYAGRIVGSGPVDDVLDFPVHPYTFGLLGSVPSRGKRGEPLRQIPGSAPSLARLPEGCAFRPRCLQSTDACRHAPEEIVFLNGRTTRCVHPRCPRATERCLTERPELKVVSGAHLVACHLIQ